MGRLLLGESLSCCRFILGHAFRSLRSLHPTLGGGGDALHETRPSWVTRIDTQWRRDDSPAPRQPFRTTNCFRPTRTRHSKAPITKTATLWHLFEEAAKSSSTHFCSLNHRRRTELFLSSEGGRSGVALPVADRRIGHRSTVEAAVAQLFFVFFSYG